MKSFILGIAIFVLLHCAAFAETTQAGHRIRISVAGSDYRHRDRTPVSPAPVVTIYNTSSNPSYISLPVIKPKNAPDHEKGEH